VSPGPPEWEPPVGWQPPAPRRNLTLYALAVIGVLLVAGYLRVVPPAFAVFLVVVVVAVMSAARKRENRARFETQLRQWYAQNANPGQHSETPPPVARPPKSGWSIAGTVLAAIAAVGGLAILAMVIVLFVALSTGNFKLGNK